MIVMMKKIPVDHHLLFCTGNKCMGKGSEDLKILAQNIRDQSPDLSTLLVTKMGCLKQCESGPMVALYPEGFWFSDMNTSRTVKLLDQIREGHSPLPENRYFVLENADQSL
jgi:(2Fe-2S) ferredoxin